jgi:hypothetical protein
VGGDVSTLVSRLQATNRRTIGPESCMTPGIECSPTSLRDDPAGRQEPGSSPVGVLFCRAPDQCPDSFADLRSTAARPRTPTPLETEAGALPRDDGPRLPDQDFGPARPKTTEGLPEESVQPVPRGSGPLALEDHDLLTEAKDFQTGVASIAIEDSEGCQE